jgi:hypothetical protein
MAVVYSSEMPATLPTSTQHEHPRAESTSIMTTVKALKQEVTVLSFHNVTAPYQDLVLVTVHCCQSATKLVAESTEILLLSHFVVK